jgi:hypothetical protein
LRGGKRKGKAKAVAGSTEHPIDVDLEGDVCVPDFSLYFTCMTFSQPSVEYDLFETAVPPV